MKTHRRKIHVRESYNCGDCDFPTETWDDAISELISLDLVLELTGYVCFNIRNNWNQLKMQVVSV